VIGKQPLEQHPGERARHTINQTEILVEALLAEEGLSCDLFGCIRLVGSTTSGWSTSSRRSLVRGTYWYESMLLPSLATSWSGPPTGCLDPVL
jgi:hypothetical protein